MHSTCIAQTPFKKVYRRILVHNNIKAFTVSVHYFSHHTAVIGVSCILMLNLMNNRTDSKNWNISDSAEVIRVVCLDFTGP